MTVNPYPMTPAERVAYIGQLIEQMANRYAPGVVRTSEPWDPHRKRRLDSMATAITLKGRQVRPKE